MYACPKYAIAMVFSTLLINTHMAAGQRTSSARPPAVKDRARVLLSEQLPALDGAHLKAFLVEVNYGPGESSRPHSHPCAVLGYVAEGMVRTQVKGEPEKTYSAGETFYEAPNGVHLVSANASTTKPAKLVAYLICDHDAPLSVNVQHINERMESQQ
jgi:quercetin dioxygenase-like cupin family protein